MTYLITITNEDGSIYTHENNVSETMEHAVEMFATAVQIAQAKGLGKKRIIEISIKEIK